MAIIPPTHSASTVELCWRRPTLMTSRSRKGEIMLMPAEKAISAIAAASRHL